MLVASFPVLAAAFSSAAVSTALGFQPSSSRQVTSLCAASLSLVRTTHSRSRFVFGERFCGRRSHLNMVRNVDLPEAIVFYGLESIMTQQTDDSDGAVLRSGVARIFKECQEVGTVALLLSEEIDNEHSMVEAFQKAWGGDVKMLRSILQSDPVIHFRCLNSAFTTPTAVDAGDALEEDDRDEGIEFYNLQANGRSPSPAFLLDSLRSVSIDPRGFGGSSGFGRGQWIEPRRSPMPARTVVFIAGDWYSNKDENNYVGGRSLVKDRCAAARAAGVRVVYIEQLLGDEESVPVLDDAQTMSGCDAVVSSFGNDNQRDLVQPISLDAISTPGDYWLNPPSSRDDVGNSVVPAEVIARFQSERAMMEDVEDGACDISDDDDDMSEEEMVRILADLDGL